MEEDGCEGQEATEEKCDEETLARSQELPREASCHEHRRKRSREEDEEAEEEEGRQKHRQATGEAGVIEARGGHSKEIAESGHHETSGLRRQVSRRPGCGEGIDKGCQPHQEGQVRAQHVDMIT